MKVIAFNLLTTWLVSGVAASFSNTNLKTKALNADTLAATLSSITTKSGTPDIATITSALQTKITAHETRINSLVTSLLSDAFLGSESQTAVLNCCAADTEFQSNGVASPFAYNATVDSTRSCIRGYCSPDADNVSKAIPTSVTSPASTDCSANIPTSGFLTAAQQNEFDDASHALKLQYFASESGVTTQFPAVQRKTDESECDGLSQNDYIKSYDGRRRPWYLNAVHKNPVDLVMHLDYSDHNTGRDQEPGFPDKVSDAYVTDRLLVMEEAVLQMFDQLRPQDRLILLDLSMQQMAEFHQWDFAGFFMNIRWPGFCPYWNQPVGYEEEIGCPNGQAKQCFTGADRKPFANECNSCHPDEDGVHYTRSDSTYYPESCMNHPNMVNLPNWHQCRAQQRLSFNSKRAKYNTKNLMSEHYRIGTMKAGENWIKAMDYRAVGTQFERVFNISDRRDPLSKKVSNANYASRKKLSMVVGYADETVKDRKIQWYGMENNEGLGPHVPTPSVKHGAPSLDRTMSLLEIALNHHPTVKRFAFGLDDEPAVMKRPDLRLTTSNYSGLKRTLSKCPWLHGANYTDLADLQFGYCAADYAETCGYWHTGRAPDTEYIHFRAQSIAMGQVHFCYPEEVSVMQDQSGFPGYTTPVGLTDGYYSKTETTDKNSEIHFAKELGRFIKYDDLQDKVSELRWSHPYKSPSGLGWLITGSKALYDTNTTPNKLMGVVGYDIDIEATFEEVVALGDDGSYGFVLTHDGYVVYHPGALNRHIEYDLNHYSDFFSETIPEVEQIISCTSSPCTKTFTYSDKSVMLNGHYVAKASAGNDVAVECEKLATEAGYDGFIVCVVKPPRQTKVADYSTMTGNVADFTMTNAKSCQHGPRTATAGIVSTLPLSAYKNKVKEQDKAAISAFINSGTATNELAEAARTKGFAKIAAGFLAGWKAMDADFAIQYPKNNGYTEKIDFVERFPLPVWRYFGGADGSFHVYPGVEAPHGFDVRGRQWYQAAISDSFNSNKVHISTPYKDILGMGWVVTVSQRIKLNDNADAGYVGVLAADYPLSQLVVALRSGAESSDFAECQEELKECLLINSAGEVVVWPKTLDGEENLYSTRNNAEGKSVNQPLSIVNMLTFDLAAIVKTDAIGKKVTTAGGVKRSCLDSFNRQTQTFIDLSAITSCQTVDNVKVCPISGTNLYNVVVTKANNKASIVQFVADEHIRELSYVRGFGDNSTVYDDCTGVVRDDMISNVASCRSIDLDITNPLDPFTAPTKDGENWLNAGYYGTSVSTPCIENMPMEAFAKTITYDEGRVLTNTGSSVGANVIAVIIIVGVVGGVIAMQIAGKK